MIRYILDTDHITLLENSDLICLQHLAGVDATGVAVTAVTLEECVQGWLKAIRQASTPQQSERLMWAYTGLRTTVQYLAGWQILDWTAASSARFHALRQQGVRIGTQDLRIASIALTRDAVVVTRNQRDFAQVPGLLIADWSM